MARSAIAGQPALPRSGVHDASMSKDIQDTMCNGAFVQYAGTAEAISFPGNVELNASSAEALTLVAPLAGNQPAGDDGKTLFAYDLAGKAHTITTPSNAIQPSHHVLTFNGTVGSNVELMARNGFWVIIGTPNGVTAS